MRRANPREDATPSCRGAIFPSVSKSQVIGERRDDGWGYGACDVFFGKSSGGIVVLLRFRLSKMLFGRTGEERMVAWGHVYVCM